VLALVIQGCHVLNRWRPGVARAVTAVCVAMAGVRVAMALLPIPFVLTYPMTWATTWSPKLGRETVVERLHSLGGQHLILVRYGPHHDPLHEYVYNRADIDAAPVVWAHNMDDESNRELLRYYPLRRAWLLEPDRDPVRLTMLAPER
jgi:hypothetical protein